MRVTIISRIYAPESAAAAFRLGALADELVSRGHDVVVLTTRPPKGLTDSKSHDYRVRRFPVLRDASGYVRGYLPYLSFDLPLFFRLVFGRSSDLNVVEPPPTTGFVTRLASAIQRRPYVYYAADVWSEAVEAAGVSRIVAHMVRGIERVALSGAKRVLTVSSDMANRARELAPTAQINIVGNGADTRVFTASGGTLGSHPYLVYAGTASEWQGARVFIDALALVRDELPNLRLVFLGHGTDWETLKSHAQTLGLLGTNVEFRSSLPPDAAARWLRGAVASVASLRPESGYESAFPTKIFASWACGAPVIFSGHGPAREFIAERFAEARLGVGCEYDAAAVADAFREVMRHPATDEERWQLGAWAAAEVSLEAVAERAATLISEDGVRR